MRALVPLLLVGLAAASAVALDPRTETAPYWGFSDSGLPCPTAPQGVGQACFVPLPGETQAGVTISDDTFLHVAGWAARYADTHFLGGTLFCDRVIVPIEDGTTQLRVSVQDPGAGTSVCYPAVAGASSGTITVTWS